MTFGVVPSYVNSWKDVTAFQWDMAPLPKGSTGKRTNSFWIWGYHMFDSSENKELAFEFQRYLASPELQASLLTNAFGVPFHREVAKGVVDTPGVQPEHKAVMVTSLDDKVTGDIYHSRFSEINDKVWSPAYEQLWLNKITAQEWAAQVNEASNKMLNEAS